MVTPKTSWQRRILSRTWDREHALSESLLGAKEWRKKSAIIGGSCHKYYFCRGKTRPLSRQKYACQDKHIFVATKLRIFYGAGIAQWLERRSRDSKVAGWKPCGSGGKFSSPGSTFCADSYFGIRSTPVLPQ